ncbi:MAG: hypothetical protein AAFQ14_18190, partial [Cyanobacteria bacterium J06621_12]
MATKNIFQTQNQITEDWQGGYKLELELTAKSDATDWQVDFELPYSIKEVYGVNLVDNDDGSYTITGQNDQASLASGQSIKPIFIIDDGGQQAQQLQITQSYGMGEMTSMIDSTTEPVTQSAPAPTESEQTEMITASSSITEDWDGGYKLEVELKADANADNWKVDFNLPYEISEAYGVDLVDNGNGNYTMMGQNDQANLASGQSIKPIFIVQDSSQGALKPEFAGSAEVMTLDLMSSETATSEPMAEETVTSEPMVEETVTSEPMVEDVVTPEPMVEETVISETISAPISAPVSNPVNIPNSSGQSVGQQG